MLNVSQNFKNDIVSTNQTLKPVLLITDADDNVIFTLTQDQDELFNIDGNLIKTINSIRKVSNVRISTDYDSKILKINRLRCTLYNYYNINTKLSEYINTTTVGKNLYMFYKSPTTNVINLTNEINKADCALVYRGEINRITFNDKSITLSIEDKTQVKIADKIVPYVSVDKLPLEQRDRLLDEYKDSDNVVPMTFGYVDKAPVLPYLENNNDRVLNVLLDFHPTASNYKTGRIPKIGKTGTNSHFCLYVKKDDDYIILDHNDKTVYQQNIKFSKFQLFTFNFTEPNYLLPSLRETNDNTENLWSYNGFTQRLVDSVYASDGSILDAKDIIDEQLSDDNFTNIKSINDNAGYEKKWYRHSGLYSNQSDFKYSDNNNFNTGLKYYPSDTVAGSGRWIILKLEKGINNDLKNIEIDGINGNTFFLADWEMYQHNNGQTTPNNTLSYLGTGQSAGDYPSRTGFFIAPLSQSIWKNNLSFSDNNVDKQADLNRLLLKSDEEIDTITNINHLIELHAPTQDTYLNAPIYLKRTEGTSGGKNYWDYFGIYNNLNHYHDYRNIQGLYYGMDSFTDEKHNANTHDLIAIFEYFPPYWVDQRAYQQGLRMNNIGFLHSVSIENLQEEKLYASIIGRKNNYYTEQLEFQDIPNSNISLNDIITGSDGLKPDDDQSLQKFFNIVIDVYNGAIETDVDFFQWSEDFEFGEFENVINNYELSVGGLNFLNLTTQQTGVTDAQSIGTFLLESYQINNIDDSAVFTNFNFFKDYIWKILCSPLLVYDLTRASADAFGDSNYHQLIQSETFIKSIGAKIFEYVLQKNIDYNDFSFNYISLLSNGTIPLNITDAVNERMAGKNWNDYNINDYDDWIDNLLVYFDNLIYAICESLREAILPYQIFNSFNFDLAEEDENFSWGTWNIQSWLNQTFPILTGFLDEEEIFLSLGNLQNELYDYANSQIQGLDPQELTTNGLIVKPSDIVMNILVNEMGYAKLNESEIVGQDIITPDYTKFDMDSIIESREQHDWIMGFSINEKSEGKQLIEDILKETKSYPRFSADGKFGLLTIKKSYTYDDINKIINLNDILDYKFSQTKREDITTSVNMFYRFDYGLEKYTFNYEKSINDINPLLEYQLNGFDNYNIEPIDSHKEIKLKYHSTEYSVTDFANFTILNNCNPHNLVELKLPLNYIDLSVGDKIHIPLINNEKIFNLDYSKVQFLNGQAIYPLWIVMETNIGVDSIKIKAYQLHYLGTDSDHKFIMPDGEYVVRGNTQELSNLNFYNGQVVIPIPNTNYDPLANQHNNIEIPYFDLNNDGIVNVVDIIKLINHIIGERQLTQNEKGKLIYYSTGQMKSNINTIDILDIVSMVNVIIDNSVTPNLN